MNLGIVVPCYNEAHRFDESAFASALDADPALSFYFVDDGSRDRTRARLEAFAATRGERCRVIAHEMNQGKAAAVRTGLLEAFATDADYCGFWDADLATPLDELPRFVEILEARPLLDLAIGSRVKLLGRSIERNPLRHYLGRVAATIASLGSPRYGGAHAIMRCTPATLAVNTLMCAEATMGYLPPGT